MLESSNWETWSRPREQKEVKKTINPHETRGSLERFFSPPPNETSLAKSARNPVEKWENVVYFSKLFYSVTWWLVYNVLHETFSRENKIKSSDWNETLWKNSYELTLFCCFTWKQFRSNLWNSMTCPWTFMKCKAKTKVKFTIQGRLLSNSSLPTRELLFNFVRNGSDSLLQCLKNWWLFFKTQNS